jgi:hypothetical protein
MSRTLPSDFVYFNPSKAAVLGFESLLYCRLTSAAAFQDLEFETRWIHGTTSTLKHNEKAYYSFVPPYQSNSEVVKRIVVLLFHW